MPYDDRSGAVVDEVWYPDTPLGCSCESGVGHGDSLVYNGSRETVAWMVGDLTVWTVSALWASEVRGSDAIFGTTKCSCCVGDDWMVVSSEATSVEEAVYAVVGIWRPCRSREWEGADFDSCPVDSSV